MIPRVALLLGVLAATALWVAFDLQDAPPPAGHELAEPVSRDAGQPRPVIPETPEPTAGSPARDTGGSGAAPAAAVNLFRRIDPAPMSSAEAQAGADRLPRWVGLDHTEGVPRPLLEFDGRGQVARPGVRLGPWRVLRAAPHRVQLRHPAARGLHELRPPEPAGPPVGGVTPGTE